MKIRLLIIFCAFLFSAAYSQDSELPKIIGDTLFTTSGYNIVEGQEIKVGRGTMVDGDFKYIRTNSSSIFAYYSTTGYNNQANSANAFPRRNSGLKYKIKSVEKRGNKKHGYVYYAKIGSGIVNYEIDVENAIESGELMVPDEFKPKSKENITVVEVNSKISVADELIKLKKLLDDGVLTQEEYNEQKKKVLE